MTRNIGLALLILLPCLSAAQTSEKHVALSISGGHDTDRRDGGRPVVLVAAGLGVPTEVFRKAFSGVHPARNGRPEPGQVHQNKDALLAVLAPYGITNDQLDRVSDFYRYRPQSGELWRHSDAEGYAIVVKGKVTGFRITKPGYGYSSVPAVSVPGFENLRLKVEVLYSTKSDTNGSLKSIVISK